MKAVKITDTSADVTIGSRADQYWKGTGINEYVSLLRPSLRLPKSLIANNTETITRYFQLKGIGFGNWVNIEDRVNYCNALIVAFYDLNKVLKFSNNIGMRGNLTVTFGDRGIPGSLAHFNSGTILININRYSRLSGYDKKLLFLSTGGVHSFAHEYGHFLDYFAGGMMDRDKGIFSLSGGHSISRSITGRKTPMRAAMDKILYTAIWDKGGQLTEYYAGILKKIADQENIGDYWVRRTELFARIFECYIKSELEEMGIINKFLTHLSYDDWAYPDQKLLKKLVPLIRELIFQIRKKI